MGKSDSTELAIINTGNLNSKLPAKKLLDELQRFNQIINAEPSRDWIKQNKFAENSEYIPISILQMNLDKVFFGLWQTQNFQHSVIANELVASIELWYYHPIAGQWIKRVGTGSVIIRFRSVKSKEKDKNKKVEQKGVHYVPENEPYENKVNALPVDRFSLENKIVNALTMDFPHLEAMCIRNAAGKIGKLFGRDLNREHRDTYSPLVNFIDLSEDLIKFKKTIDGYKESAKLRTDSVKLLTELQAKDLTVLEQREAQLYANAKYKALVEQEMNKKQEQNKKK